LDEKRLPAYAPAAASSRLPSRRAPVTPPSRMRLPGIQRSGGAVEVRALRNGSAATVLRVPSAEPVFGFAEDGLDIFASLAELGGWIEAPDVEDGVYEAIFMLDAEVVEPIAEGLDVTLKRTGVADLEGLLRRPSRARPSFRERSRRSAWDREGSTAR
jgi:hypothetical protein